MTLDEQQEQEDARQRLTERRAEPGKDPWKVDPEPVVRRTPTKKEILLERGGGVCFYCEAPLTPETATLDHIIPKADGGTRDPSNLVVACRDCNNERGDIPQHEYLGRFKMRVSPLRERRRRATRRSAMEIQ